MIATKNVLEFTHTPNEEVDLEDGRKVWLSRAPTVNSVVLFEVRDVGDVYVAASRRGPGAHDNKGKWNTACGYLDWDEDAVQAAKREMWEELGLYFSTALFADMNILVDHFSDQPWRVAHAPRRDAYQNVTLHYGVYATVSALPDLKINGTCGETDEVDAVEWINVDKLGDYEWAFNHGNIIQEYLTKSLEIIS